MEYAWVVTADWEEDNLPIAVYDFEGEAQMAVQTAVIEDSPDCGPLHLTKFGDAGWYCGGYTIRRVPRNPLRLPRGLEDE